MIGIIDVLFRLQNHNLRNNETDTNSQTLQIIPKVEIHSDVNALKSNFGNLKTSCFALICMQCSLKELAGKWLRISSMFKLSKDKQIFKFKYLNFSNIFFKHCRIQKLLATSFSRCFVGYCKGFENSMF